MNTFQVSNRVLLGFLFLTFSFGFGTRQTGVTRSALRGSKTRFKWPRLPTRVDQDDPNDDRVLKPTQHSRSNYFSNAHKENLFSRCRRQGNGSVAWIPCQTRVMSLVLWDWFGRAPHRSTNPFGFSLKLRLEINFSRFFFNNFLGLSERLLFFFLVKKK